MKKLIVTTMTCSLLAGAGAALSGCSMFPWRQAEDTALVPFSTIPSGAYQSFVKNWDDRQQPVLCVLIRSQDDWNHWFQPAATTPARQTLTPSDDYFQTRQLLMAARVIQAPDSAERSRIFTADKVSMRDGLLKLEYRFVPPRSGATYQVKDFLLVEIPRERYTTGPVQFIENGRTVCQIPR